MLKNKPWQNKAVSIEGTHFLVVFILVKTSTWYDELQGKIISIFFLYQMDLSKPSSLQFLRIDNIETKKLVNESYLFDAYHLPLSRNYFLFGYFL